MAIKVEWGSKSAFTDTQHTHRVRSLAQTHYRSCRIIAALDGEQSRLDTLDAATAVGRGTVSVTEIGGGVARNIIPDLCTLYAGRRIAPGKILAVYEALKALVISAGEPLQVDVEMANGTAFPAFYTDPDDDFVQLVAGLSERAPETVTYGSNCLAYDEITASKVLLVRVPSTKLTKRLSGSRLTNSLLRRRYIANC